MKKIYVGCALTQVREGFLEEVVAFKNELRKRGYEVLEFAGPNGTPEEVVLNDAGCVEKCDLFVAIATGPSTGLGYELAVAEFNKKPVIAVAKHGEKVSRLVQGLKIRNPKFSFVLYNSLSEIIPIAKKALS